MNTKTDTATPASSPLVENVRVAMRKAFQIGQTYWQQADSESVSQNSKSDETATKFRQLVTDTCTDLAAAVAPQAPDTPVAPITWLTRCIDNGRHEEVDPHKKASNPNHWTNAFPVFAHPATPLPAAPAPTDIEAVYDFMGFGSQARSLSNLMVCLRNMNHFADLLHAVEREFFMVPGEPDEDFPDEEPQDECLLNCWGSTEAQYIEQFRAALAARQAPASTLTQSRDRDPWTDEQRANHRANKALVYRCTVCCARSGEPHLPSCSEGQGICGA